MAFSVRDFSVMVFIGCGNGKDSKLCNYFNPGQGHLRSREQMIISRHECIAKRRSAGGYCNGGSPVGRKGPGTKRRVCPFCGRRRSRRCSRCGNPVQEEKICGSPRRETHGSFPGKSQTV